MKHYSLLIGPAAIIFVVAMLFSCGDLPPNVAADPNYADIALFAGNDDIGQKFVPVNQGDSLKIGVKLVFLDHFQKVRISSSCGVIDQEFVPDSTVSFDTVYFDAFFSSVGPCSVFVNAQYKEKNLKDKADTLACFVFAKKAAVEFTGVPSSVTTCSGKTDTLLFVTKTTGSASPPEYALLSAPTLDDSRLFRIPSPAKDTARIVFKPEVADTYTVRVIATSEVSGENDVGDTATVGIRVYEAITPSTIDAPQTIVAGTADTLMFVVDNSDRDDPLTLQLVTGQPLDPDIFTVIASGADSLLIAVTPATGETGTINIGIATTNGTITDTAWYPVIFLEKDNALWNKAGVAVTATEGKTVQYDLRPSLIASEGDPVTFTADIGTITDTVWEWKPTYGCEATAEATVTATKGDGSMGLKLAITVTPGDLTGPSLRLADETLDGKTVGSSQITVECIAKDSEAGVGKVTFTRGTATVDASLQIDSVFSGLVSGLQDGVPTQITITAHDKSMNKNSKSLTFTITYDSTAFDKEAPAISTQPTATLKVNEGETLELSVVATGTPEPVYQWYKDNVKLTDNTNAEFSKADVAASDAGVYHVVVSNGVGTDVSSAKATVTVALKATITENPSPVSVNEGGSASFAVKAAGEAPLSYKWLIDGVEISGAVDSTYTIPAVTTVDDGKKFSCKVSNTFSNVTSTAALLTVEEKTIYKVTFDCDGGEGTSCGSEQNVKEGEKATKPTTDPTKTGHEFAGWYSPKGASTAFNFSTVITGNTTIYAKWTPVSYTVKFDRQDGTAPTSTPVAHGGKVTKPADPTKSGYLFAGWYTSSSLSTPFNFTTAITGDCEVFAKWDALLYNITYNVNGGNHTGNPSSYSSAASTINLNNAEKVAYVFDGWYSNAGMTIKVTSIPAGSTGDKEFWAKWVIKDKDNNTYSELTIGSQVWMVENLKTTKYNDGTSIPLIAGNDQWASQTIGAYCWHENNTSNGSSYGALYNWYAVNTGKLAPKGWHVPTDAEWTILENYLIANGYNWDGTTTLCKIGKSMAATTKWNNFYEEGAVGNDVTSNNKSKFSAFPGGCRYNNGTFDEIGNNGFWWTATEDDTIYAWNIYIYYTSIGPGHSTSGKMLGYSVRCIRDY